jgi:glycosyltransferase involved in cell wall biosynthesis
MSRLKVIVISHTFPYPPHNGNVLPIYHYLRCLAPCVDFTLVTHIHEDPEKHRAGTELFESWGIEMVSVDRIIFSRFKQLLNCLRHGIPWFNRFFSIKLMRKIHELLEEIPGHHSEIKEAIHPVIHVEGIMSGQHLAGFRSYISTHGILVARDCLSLNHHRRWKSERHPTDYLQGIKIGMMEKSLYGKFRYTLAISGSDAGEMKRICPGSNVEILPNGVDISVFKPMPCISGGRIVAFSGSMEYAPNIEAAVYFAREVWPTILQKIPDAEFMIVGQKPAARVLELDRLPGVRVTGGVPNMAETMSAASVIVSPLKWGTGIKNKVLEGAALGKAMVVSPCSLDGILLKPKLEIEVAETSEEYTVRVQDLLNNEPRRKQMGESARRVIVENYTWEKHAEILWNLYHKIAGTDPEDRHGDS